MISALGWRFEGGPYDRRVLVAYLDEFGHVGPYIGTGHGKFFHHPIFGYAGIVLPGHSIRAFGAKFEHVKARQFRLEILESGKHPRRWEKKGSEIFTTGSYERYPARVDFIEDLAVSLKRLHGRLFYYGEVKPVGPTSKTHQTPAERTQQALIETVRRLCRYAEACKEDLMVLLDDGGPMPREDAITSMASFIYSSEDRSMKRIIEVPMQLESHRYGALQFADWMCAVLTRTTHFHFTDSDEFHWSPSVYDRIFRDRATRESRIWIPQGREPVTFGALRRPDRWIDRAKRSGRGGAHLTQRIGDSLLS